MAGFCYVENMEKEVTASVKEKSEYKGGGNHMKTIITIQHTQSVHHTNGMVGSWTDWDLSELGVEQAKKIGEKLKDEWNRLKPFFDEIISGQDDDLIVVSHGDLLSVFNTMFMGLDVESMNDFEAFGLSGGVSCMFINDEGKRYIKRVSDMSYIM